jgi:hypothetical protein
MGRESKDLIKRNGQCPVFTTGAEGSVQKSWGPRIFFLDVDGKKEKRAQSSYPSSTMLVIGGIESGVGVGDISMDLLVLMLIWVAPGLIPWVGIDIGRWLSFGHSPWIGIVFLGLGENV